MRKTSTKLQLKANTIRVLGSVELARVNAGGPASTHPFLCRVSYQCDPDGGGGGGGGGGGRGGE